MQQGQYSTPCTLVGEWTSQPAATRPNACPLIQLIVLLLGLHQFYYKLKKKQIFFCNIESSSKKNVQFYICYTFQSVVLYGFLYDSERKLMVKRNLKINLVWYKINFEIHALFSDYKIFHELVGNSLCNGWIHFLCLLIVSFFWLL